jgi:hypothetical protein
MRHEVIYDMRDEDEVYEAGEIDVYDDVEEFISALKEGDMVYSTHNFEGDGFGYYCGDLPTYTYTEGEMVEEIVHHSIVSDYVEHFGFKRNAEAIRKYIAEHPNAELAG